MCIARHTAMTFLSISAVLVLSLMLFSGLHCGGTILNVWYNLRLALLQHLIYYCLIIKYLILHTVGECNYLYDSVPSSSNDTTCTISEGNTVYFSCVVYDRCNSISVLWYKSRNVRGSSEQIIGALEPGSKFQIFAIAVPITANNFSVLCFYWPIVAK